MPDTNRISAVISDADKATILQKIGEIRALLPFLISLTPEERQALPKLGDATLGFDQKCGTYMVQSPTLVPGFVDMAEVDKDRGLRVPLTEIELNVESLTQAIVDSNLLVGSEIYNAELAFYQNTRQAAKRGIAGAQVIYDDLKARFPGANPQAAQPPTPAAKAA